MAIAPTTARPTNPDSIRNVALVGHTAAGKTTLIEALLHAAGEISRIGRVEDGTTVTDFDDAAIRQQRSVGVAIAPLQHKGTSLNLIDTPGYPDYVGELRAGLRAAECALFVIPATAEVDGSTRLLWEECASVGMPRMIVLSRLDHARADVAGSIDLIQAQLGEKCMPLFLPISEGAKVVGLLSLLEQVVYEHGRNGIVERPLTADEELEIEDLRSALIESIIEESEDETLMDRYLSGEQISLDVIIPDLEQAIARGSFHPIMPVCATTGVGLRALLDVAVRAFPAPSEHPMPEVFTVAGATYQGIACDPDGPLLAEVIKTSTDPYLGRVSTVRIFSGRLVPDMTVHVAGRYGAFQEVRGHEEHDEDERIGGLSSPMGRTLRPINAGVAGDIVTVARLTRAETGDTLSSPEVKLVMRPWSLPEPLYPVAIHAASKADEDKMSTALARVASEDPTLRVEHNAETHQVVLWTMGDAHADLVIDRMAARYSVRVERGELRTPMRETFLTSAPGHGRHVKQSGGHGQYAVCDIIVAPLPQGSGMKFVDKVVGGAVPRQFIPSVEKGVAAQLEKGLVAGYKVVDLEVTLVDGKAHSVDSSDMAFQMAGAQGLKEAAAKAQMALLEPVDTVHVIVEDDFVGGVMSDLSGRRGRVLGTEPTGRGRTRIAAEVPAMELVRYALDLRSMTHGTGTFSRTFIRYEPLPAHLVASVPKNNEM